MKQDEIKEWRKEIFMSHGISSGVIEAKTMDLHRNSKPEVHQWDVVEAQTMNLHKNSKLEVQLKGTHEMSSKHRLWTYVGIRMRSPSGETRSPAGRIHEMSFKQRLQTNIEILNKNSSRWNQPARKEILMSHEILSGIIEAKTMDLHGNSKPEVHQWDVVEAQNVNLHQNSELEVPSGRTHVMSLKHRLRI